MEMVNGGDQALAAALSFVAPRGDEGRAIAFLTMQNALAKPGTKITPEVRGHLAESVARIDEALKANMQRMSF